MNTFKEILKVTHKLFFPGYFGTYCGCELDDVKDMCGLEYNPARGRPECTQTKATATGAASCACNTDWADKDSNGDRSAHMMML